MGDVANDEGKVDIPANEKEVNEALKRFDVLASNLEATTKRIDDTSGKLKPVVSDIKWLFFGLLISVFTVVVLLLYLYFFMSGETGNFDKWEAFAYYSVSLVFLCVMPLVCGYVIKCLKERF